MEWFIDNNTRITKVVLVDKTELEGDFRLTRGKGDLGYAGVVFVVGNGKLIPLTSILYMEVKMVDE